MFSLHKKTDSEYATELVTSIASVDRIKIITYLGRLAKRLIVGSRKVTNMVKPPDRYMCFVCTGDLDRDKDISSVNHKHHSGQTLLVTVNTDGEYVQAIFYDPSVYKDIGDIEFRDLRESITKIGVGQEVAVMELWYIASTMFHLMAARQIPAGTIVPSLFLDTSELSRTPTSLMVNTSSGIVEYRILK